MVSQKIYIPALIVCILAACSDIGVVETSTSSQSEIAAIDASSSEVLSSEILQTFEFSGFIPNEENIGQLSSAEGTLSYKNGCLYLESEQTDFLLYLPKGAATLEGETLTIFDKRILDTQKYRFSGYSPESGDELTLFAGQRPTYFDKCAPERVFIAYDMN